jgi:hypothetical protein
MATFKPTQVAVGRDVQQFALAVERLLRPLPGGKEFTRDECAVISEYLGMMCRGKHPWTKHFEAMIGSRAAKAKIHRYVPSGLDGHDCT